LKARGAARSFKSSPGCDSSLGTDCHATAYGVAARTGNGGPGCVSAAWAFDDTAIYVEIVPCEAISTAETVQAFVGGQAEKVVEFSATGRGETIASKACGIETPIAECTTSCGPKAPIKPATKFAAI
jgi:hypothetical protein